MPAIRRLLVLAVTLGVLSGGALYSMDQPHSSNSSENSIYLTRIFYLHGIDAHEAMMSIRKHVSIRHIVMIPGMSVVVVCDVPERVNASEKLLRDSDAIERVVSPHGPLNFEELKTSPTERRVFHVNQTHIKDIPTVLRTTYSVRDLNVSEEDGTVSIRAAPQILEACEALLRELGFLAEESKG